MLTKKYGYEILNLTLLKLAIFDPCKSGAFCARDLYLHEPRAVSVNYTEMPPVINNAWKNRYMHILLIKLDLLYDNCNNMYNIEYIIKDQ